jgi:menaquinone-specific isochorismate synthase
MSDPNEDASKVGRAVELAGASGQTQWVARVVEVDSVDTLRCYARCEPEDRFVWERGESQEAFVAWGRVDEIESAGSERFHDVEAWAAEVGSRLHWLGRERPRTAPLFVGGFGFEEDGTSAAEWKAFPSARFVLPATIGEGRANGGTFTLLARVEPGVTRDAIELELTKRLVEAKAFMSAPIAAADDAEKLGFDRWKALDWPPGPEYRVRSDRAHSVFADQIDLALEAIDAGRLDKAVLARSLRVDHDGRLDIPGFLDRLSTLYPSCTLLAMGRGNDTFLAATPETLIRVQHDRIETAALAGSAPRGRTPEVLRARSLGAAETSPTLRNPASRDAHFGSTAIDEGRRAGACRAESAAPARRCSASDAGRRRGSQGSCPGLAAAIRGPRSRMVCVAGGLAGCFRRR